MSRACAFSCRLDQGRANLQDLTGRSQIWSRFSSVLLVDSYVWRQKSSNIRAIYYLANSNGKWGQCSTESASRFENRAEGSNKAEPPWLVVLAKVRPLFGPRVSHFLKVRTAELLATRKYHEMCQI